MRQSVQSDSGRQVIGVVSVIALLGHCVQMKTVDDKNVGGKELLTFVAGRRPRGLISY